MDTTMIGRIIYSNINVNVDICRAVIKKLFINNKYNMEKDPNITKVKDVLNRGLLTIIILKLGLLGFNGIGLTTLLYLIF